MKTDDITSSDAQHLMLAFTHLQSFIIVERESYISALEEEDVCKMYKIATHNFNFNEISPRD